MIIYMVACNFLQLYSPFVVLIFCTVLRNINSVHHWGKMFLQVMPYSTGCKTPLSNFEANQNYKVTSCFFPSRIDLLVFCTLYHIDVTFTISNLLALLQHFLYMTQYWENTSSLFLPSYIQLYTGRTWSGDNGSFPIDWWTWHRSCGVDDHTVDLTQ